MNNQISLLSLSNEELDTKIKKLKSDFLASLAVEFAETQSSKTRAEAALSKVNRRIGASNILAPEDGIITSLDVTTPGQVIGAGQVLATLVPISDDLIIEAKLPPGDINYVSVGQKANVMLSAYDVRVYGKLIGEVTKIGSNTFIGSGSVIKNNITVGNNCFIRMGTIVSKNIPNNSRF